MKHTASRRVFTGTEMREEISIPSAIKPMENTTPEYANYLRERVENSPLSFSGNPFFKELSRNPRYWDRAQKEEKAK